MYAVKTIHELEDVARDLHGINFRLRGDRYATEREMETILDDPLAYYGSIQDQLTLTTGNIIQWREVRIADDDELFEAAKRESKRLSYMQEWKKAQSEECEPCLTNPSASIR